ncbi:putative nucleic acid-binding protein [Pararhizobium capsulatum DSM 1112]|uniref:Ribonuclease VapC n=1 Tax=Pararhizobium capsulatum DSM 1112 TaxID=1121113 RepID=A0ABU0BMG5_9HYPH|nr:type II toxin-antitoxin system VapC family toxin [Pararhizobium capsulatum]MDQ0318876.1 putative nucleic acid-binding protein [Pararhizobium capsulatum DSM 1112]
MSGGYLLDTSVLSRFAPGRPDASSELREWMRDHGAAEALFISSMTIAEIEKGVCKLERQGAAAKSKQVRAWLEGIVATFEDRILPMDTATAVLAGAIEDAAVGRGRNPGLADVIIAATAQRSGLTVVTDNVRHFEELAVPFERPV